MCILNNPPFDDDDDEQIDYPIAHGLPQLAWAIPVDICQLGASLEAYSETLPQTTTLQLCHRFRDCPLSRLPQELLEQITNEVRQLKRAKLLVKWNQDFTCFQGLCRMENHYAVYDDKVEETWRQLFVEGRWGSAYRIKKGHYTEDEKLEMLENAASGDPDMFWNGGGAEMHYDARYGWIDRTCLCSTNTASENGRFIPLNDILRLRFGLRAIILHEKLSDDMTAWLPNTHWEEDKTYYTSCYLALSPGRHKEDDMSDQKGSKFNPLFRKCDDHTAFRQIIDPSHLCLSEDQRLRFPKAMRYLNLKPRYHLSEMEPHVIHPIEDEFLMDTCSCNAMDCPASPDHKSWDKPYFVAEHLERKSKELANTHSWPKLMSIAASDAVSPTGWYSGK